MVWMIGWVCTQRSHYLDFFGRLIVELFFILRVVVHYGPCSDEWFPWLLAGFVAANVTDTGKNIVVRWKEFLYVNPDTKRLSRSIAFGDRNQWNSPYKAALESKLERCLSITHEGFLSYLWKDMWKAIFRWLLNTTHKVDLKMGLLLVVGVKERIRWWSQHLY